MNIELETAIKTFTIAALVISGAASGIFLSAAHSAEKVSAEAKVMQIFKAEVKAKDINEEEIRKLVVNQLPIGSTAQSVEEYLTKNKGEGDSQIDINGTATNSCIICRINYDNKSFGVVKSSYDIAFKMNSAHKLEQVEVKRHLTGL